MTTDHKPKTFSPAAVVVCEICGFIWLLTTMGVCTYIVFWLGHSGWWYLLAMIIASGWSCKSLRSPEQIRASQEGEA